MLMLYCWQKRSERKIGKGASEMLALLKMVYEECPTKLSVSEWYWQCTEHSGLFC